MDNLHTSNNYLKLLCSNLTIFYNKRNLFVHGFALDGFGKKMSKSDGNVIDPMAIIDGDGKQQQALGIDVLRYLLSIYYILHFSLFIKYIFPSWWTASRVSGNGSSVSVSTQSIQQSSEDVQKIRSVLRFLLGNLNDVKIEQLQSACVHEFSLTDNYMLHLLTEFVTLVCISQA